MSDKVKEEIIKSIVIIIATIITVTIILGIIVYIYNDSHAIIQTAKSVLYLNPKNM